MEQKQQIPFSEHIPFYFVREVREREGGDDGEHVYENSVYGNEKMNLKRVCETRVIRFNMGTHSRIVIKRTRGRELYFWQRFDGYLECVGKELCEVITDLFGEFSTDELLQMANKIVYDLNDDYITFETKLLRDILIGKQKAICNDYQAFEFEYVVDFTRECLTAQHGDTLVKLPFECLKRGFVFSDFVEFL